MCIRDSNTTDRIQEQKEFKEASTYQNTKKHMFGSCFWQFLLKISFISVFVYQNTEPGRSILVKIQARLRLYIRKNTKNELCDLDSW